MSRRLLMRRGDLRRGDGAINMIRNASPNLGATPMTTQYLTRDQFDPLVFGGKRAARFPHDPPVLPGDRVMIREVDPDAAILTGRWVLARVTMAHLDGAWVSVGIELLQAGITHASLEASGAGMA